MVEVSLDAILRNLHYQLSTLHLVEIPQYQWRYYFTIPPPKGAQIKLLLTKQAKVEMVQIVK
jgi:hypothetical protein